MSQHDEFTLGGKGEKRLHDRYRVEYSTLDGLMFETGSGKHIAYLLTMILKELRDHGRMAR